MTYIEYTGFSAWLHDWQQLVGVVIAASVALIAVFRDSIADLFGRRERDRLFNAKLSYCIRLLQTIAGEYEIALSNISGIKSREHEGVDGLANSNVINLRNGLPYLRVLYAPKIEYRLSDDLHRLDKRIEWELYEYEECVSSLELLGERNGLSFYVLLSRADDPTKIDLERADRFDEVLQDASASVKTLIASLMEAVKSD